MFGETPLDPTAGQRARDIRAMPDLPRPILDPTDPRYGVPVPDPGREDDVRRIGRHEAVTEPHPGADESF